MVGLGQWWDWVSRWDWVSGGTGSVVGLGQQVGLMEGDGAEDLVRGQQRKVTWRISDHKPVGHTTVTFYRTSGHLQLSSIMLLLLQP